VFVVSDYNYNIEHVLTISYEYLKQENSQANITKNLLLVVRALFNK
jgi:hypothetical protein